MTYIDDSDIILFTDKVKEGEKMLFKYNIFGYDKEGYNRKGFDKKGFNRNGFDKYGYDKNGYDVNGYDKQGFDRNGYNVNGFDRLGYDLRGYDKSGYDKQGFNSNGYDINGFGKDGYNSNGYDKQGYDRNGYDVNGLDKLGFDSKGYDKNGYDKQGFDGNGYDQDGFDKKGYNSNGYDKQGFNRNGFDEYGYDKNGYDVNGYDKQGFDRNGYNADGFDSLGFDKNGYDIDGFNKDGYNANGYDKQGYDRNGYDVNGLDKLGFDSKGYDKNGYDKQSFDGSGYDRDGFDKDSLDEDGNNFDGYNCKGEKFIDIDRIINLTKKTFNNKSFENLNELGDTFYSGSCGIKNYELANYIYDMAKGKKVSANEQYYSAPTENAFVKTDNTFEKQFHQEKKHLKNVKKSIDNDIIETSNSIIEVEKETWWMDFDQKNEWRATVGRNRQKQEKISLLQNIKNRPYYARMDIKASKEINTVYIGEEPYNSKDNSCSVYSVWSDVGRRYRQKRLSSFRYDETLYEIQLRRNIDIKDSELINIYDEFNINSDATRENITDLYLLKVLEEKKGEKNITNIIRSIQLNQNTIIDYDFQKNLLVQGCAGSGKTMILLHRLANMKFNNPNMDYSKVKIITPNSNFSLFIDDLSKNLHIEKISRMTMAEYWADIIYRYRLQSGGSGKNVNYIAYKDDDTPLEEKTIIYSADFVQQLEKKVAGITERELKYQKTISTSKPIKDEFGNVKRDKNGKPKTETIDGAEKLLDDALDETFKFFNLGVSSTDKVACVLYSKVLAIYFYYGKALIKNDSLLCIDEGQDISILQYDLMLRVNDNSVRFNIYGDINQRLPSNYNIDDWDTLLKYINAKKFVLNENYRNSEEIIQFYNQKLSMSNLSFGLKTKEVEKISHKTLIWKVLLNLILGNRTAIICNDCNLIPNDIKEFCSFNDLSATDKAHVLTVKQAKGLEYDTVFVYDDGMNKNERYIAYTRALSELYILE